MTMRRSNVLRPFANQQPMRKAGPPHGDARASDSDIRSMTGSSRGPGGQTRVHHERIGDHRQPGLHSGSETRSRVPHVTAGRPFEPGSPPDDAA